jgi:dipeptidyl-peptidase-4
MIRLPVPAFVLACGLAAAAPVASVPVASAPAASAPAASAPVRPASPREDFLERYAATRGFRSGQPTAVAIPRDASEVLFLRSGPRDRVQSLWAWDPRTGSEREVVSAEKLLAGAHETLSAEERALRERKRLTARGLTSFTLSRDGRFVLVPLSGRLFLVTRPGYQVRELGERGLAAADDARLSPDGSLVALVRGGAMRVLDIAGRTERVIAAPESAGVTYGLAEFVAQEEMSRFEGHWWSPDSRWLAVQRTDHAGMERLRIMDPANPTAPPVENPYPRPGMRNADVRLAVYAAAGGPPVWVQWDRDAWPYLCRVTWPEAGPLTIYVMDRRQQRASLLTVDPASGLATPLLGEQDAKWLNLPEGAPRWLADGKSFLWIGEKDDTGPQLDLHLADATSRRLTPPGLRVQALLAVDATRSLAYVRASDEPTESHVWSVDLRRPWKLRRLGEARGVESAVVSPGGELRVRALSPERGPARWLVEDLEGAALGELNSVAEDPGLEPVVEWARVGRDSLRAFIVRPRDFRPGLRYPVVDWAYAGPHSQRVTRHGRRYLLEQWLADQGFIVVTVDGRGTPSRGRSFERAIRGDFIGPALEDHRTALRELAGRHPEMDAARVGALGWSFGGYYAAQAVMHAPEVYRAGVAGAPVVDWHDYDTFYTERYLGVPPGDSAAYTRSSVLLKAAGLSRPLLVVHGTADDNVYFVHSLELASALNRDNRAYEFLPLPGQTHVVSAPEQVRFWYGRAMEFLKRELGGVSDAAPPRP